MREGLRVFNKELNLGRGGQEAIKIVSSLAWGSCVDVAGTGGREEPVVSWWCWWGWEVRGSDLSVLRENATAHTRGDAKGRK